MEIQSPDSRRWLGNYPATPGQVRLVKSLDAAALPAHSPPAIIVHPGPDLDGDITNPAGGDWRPFELNPVVNYGHAVPIGVGSVVMKSITHGGQRVDVPVGTSKFFEKSADLRGLSLNKYDNAGNVVGKWDEALCLHFAEEIGPKVLAGIVNSVSVEMFVQKNFCKSLGKLSGNTRESYRVDRWDGLGYAHTLVPVHLSARMWDEDEELRVEKAIDWRSRVPARTGFGFIRKSLDGYISATLAERPNATKTVMPVRTPGDVKASANGVHRKKAGENPFAKKKDAPDDADPETEDNANAPPAEKSAPKEVASNQIGDDQEADPDLDDEYGLGQDDATDPANAAMNALDDGVEPVPVGIQASMDFVQALSDACAAYNAAMKASDNPKLIGFSNTEIAKVMKRSAFIQRYADAVGAKIKSGGMTEDEPSPDDEDDLDGDGVEDDLEDEDGTETDPTKPDAEEPVAEGDAVPEKKKKKPTPDTDDEGNVVSKSFTGYTPSVRTFKSKMVTRHRKSDFGPPVGKGGSSNPPSPQVPPAKVEIEGTDDGRAAELAELRKRIDALSKR